MAETTPKKKASGKKLLGLSPWVWGGIVVGSGGILWFLHERNAAATAAAATGTTDGQTTPAVGTSSSTTTPPATLSAWIDDAIGGSNLTATYTSSDLLNDIDGWLSGQCVSSQGYSVIGNLVQTLGVPPGYSTTPSLMVCASTASTGTTGTGTTGTGTTTTGTGSTSTTTTPTAVNSLLSGISVTNASAILANVTGQNGSSLAEGAAGPDGSVSINSLVTLLENAGLSFSEAYTTATESFNQQQASGGLVGIPGFPNVTIAAAPTGTADTTSPSIVARVVSAVSQVVPTVAPTPATTPGGTTPAVASNPAPPAPAPVAPAPAPPANTTGQLIGGLNLSGVPASVLAARTAKPSPSGQSKA